MTLLGWLAGQRLDPGNHRGVETTRPPRPGPVFQSSDALLAEPFAPLRGHVDTHSDLSSDVDITYAISGQQHDPSPDHLSVRLGARRRPHLKDRPVRPQQSDLERRTTRHEPVSPPDPHRRNPTPTYTDVIIGRTISGG